MIRSFARVAGLAVIYVAASAHVGSPDAWFEGMAGPYHVTVPARRTKHVRFNDLTDPEPIPRATDYASVIESDVPIVVQHTRLDSRQAENALLSTVAFADAATAGAAS